MKKKSPELLSIEQAFLSIKSNPKGNHLKDLEMIQRILSRRYNIRSQINIVKNDNSEFFGMSIYPAEDVIDKIVDNVINETDHIRVINEIWSKNDNWVIEIDSKLIEDPSLNANPQEITAVLLHEIGHTIQSNEIPERIGKVLKYTHIQLSVNVKKILKWSKARKIMGLAVIEACGNTNYRRALRREVDADKLAVDEGYGEDLSQFIDKLITKKGNKYVDRTEQELDQEVETVVRWGIENVSQLEYRKNVLNRSIQAQMMNTKSPFIRNYLLNIRKLFFGKSEDKLQQMVAEQYALKEYTKYNKVTEAFKDLFGKNGRIAKVTSQDIDYIIIETNRIENENDRIYVLDLIYNKLDVIELSLDLLSNNETAHKVQVSKETLKRQKEELLNLRKQVMSIKIKPRDFTLLVNYPSGYEG